MTDRQAPPRVRIIALGQAVAGDDGAGLAVLEALEQRIDDTGTGREGLDLVRARDASELCDLVCDVGRVILLDALTGAGPPGRILVASVEDLSARPSSELSTHGLGVRQAIELSRVASPDRACKDIRVVAVTIDPPAAYSTALSPAVERAIPEAVAAIVQLLARAAQRGTAHGEASAPAEPAP